MIHHFAQDILLGNFSEINMQMEIDKQKNLEQEASEMKLEQKTVQAAVAEAGHEFKKGNFHKVVKLLSPYLDLLAPSQKKRLEVAIEKANTSVK